MTNKRRRLEGRVVSNKMDKTVSVEIESFMVHRLYKKVVRTTKKVMAHDESNSVPLGAVVRIVESKPLSRHKRWAVETVLVDPGNKVVEPLPTDDDVAVMNASAGDDTLITSDDASAGDDTLITSDDASADADASADGEA